MFIREVASRIEETDVQPCVVEHPPFVSTALDDEVIPMPHEREDLEMLSVYTDIYDPVAKALHEEGDVERAVMELEKRWPDDEVDKSLAIGPLLPEELEKYAADLRDAFTS